MIKGHDFLTSHDVLCRFVIGCICDCPIFFILARKDESFTKACSVVSKCLSLYWEYAMWLLGRDDLAILAHSLNYFGVTILTSA